MARRRFSNLCAHVLIAVVAFLCTAVFLSNAVPNPQDPIKRLPPTGNANALVVGAGPVGLYTAAKLARKGFNVTIIDKREDFIGRLQVVAVWHEDGRRLLNEHVSWAGCINFIPSMVKVPQCLDFYRRNRLIVDSNGALNPDMFLQAYTTSEIQEGFYREFKNIAYAQWTGNHDVKIMSFADVTSEMLEEADVIVCADGSKSACRAKFIPDNKPERTRGELAPTDGSPDAYGGTVILRAKDIRDERRNQIMSVSSSTMFPPRQHLYRGFLAHDGLFYLGVGMMKDEYKRLEGIDQKSPEFRSAFIDAIGHRIIGGLDFYGVSDLKDAVYEKASFGAFPITLQHQPKDGFALLRPRAAESKKGDQIVIMVGDAAIASHYFGFSGLNLGLTVAESAVSFLSPAVFRPRGTLGSIRNRLTDHDEKKKKKMVKKINAANYEISFKGRQRSLAVLPPWLLDERATGVVPQGA
ncbi:hypothetical protein HK102_000003 [Quaeritorhiza haematococci]|nr:hypothetical protein HK102_000003 [Quaeritorhiza haematococci]